jgi:hypothetical protein
MERTRRPLHRPRARNRRFALVGWIPIPARVSGQGIEQIHVTEVDFAVVTVALISPVLPQVDTWTEYRPPGRRKVAMPALSAAAERLVSLPVTST